MRILMTAGFYALGGSSTVIQNLADQLGKMSVKVTIGALTFQQTTLGEAHDIRTLPIHNITRLRKFLDTFDIVHNHNPITNYLTLISRRPFIYHYHGAPDFGKRQALKFHMLFSVKATRRAFDSVIAVSETASEELKRYFGLTNVNVIYNGVDTTRFKQNLEEKFRIGTPQFLFVGNLYAHKNVEELMLALKELVSIYPKACLQIVGNGGMYTQLKRFAAKLELEENIKLIGHVSDRELPYYYASCDVYVTASRWELFGLPLLEAMACGKPIVASSISPHMELLKKSKAGTVYNAGNTEDLCKKMIRVYEVRKKLKSYAFRFAKQHDWSIMANRVLGIYNHVLHN